MPTSRSTPGAVEYCDSADNDCNGVVDDYPADGPVWCWDADGDGFGNRDDIIVACELPTGSSADCSDCNDWTSAAYPGAPEYCDGIDNNCDGEVDESPAVTPERCFIDADGDGYGDAISATDQCTCTEGDVWEGGDCDVSSRRTHG